MADIQLNDIIVYANKQRDLVVGFPLVNGRPAVMVRPMDGRKAWMASDALKDRRWLDDFIRLEVFTLVRPENGNFDPDSGVIFDPLKEKRLAYLEASLQVAHELLEEARDKHGTEDLSLIRDEWELHKRLESVVRRLRAS